MRFRREAIHFQQMLQEAIGAQKINSNGGQGWTADKLISRDRFAPVQETNDPIALFRIFWFF